MRKIVLTIGVALSLAAPAQAHVNPTAEGYSAALRSCDRAYAAPGQCDLYGGANFGRHSYKAYVYWPMLSTICRAVILVFHNSKVIGRHRTYCGGWPPKRRK